MSTGAGKTILIMAGGTGGHIFPALSIADALRERGYRIEWLGTRRGLEVQVLQGTDIPLNFLTVAGLRGKGAAGMLLAPFMLLRSTWQALAILGRVRPCCVLGMGGYVTGPGGVAAKLSGRKLLIHEQNAVAGFSNRMLAKIADRVMQAFPDTFADKPTLRTTGNPVRREIRAIAEPQVRLGNRSGPLRILVIGGSLGAVAINSIIPQVLAFFDAGNRPRVLHQAGNRNIEETQAWYQEHQLPAESCQVVPFIADMAAAYAEADLVICRAGAITVAELAVAGVASVLIPYPHAVDDHQTLNAKWLTDAGAAVLIQQADLDARSLFNLICRFTEDRAGLITMATAARSLAQADATEQVSAACMEFCDA